MPLGTRDVLLIIRAKDQASRIIQGVGRSFVGVNGEAEAAAARTMNSGAALIGLGIGIAAVGAAGVNALNNWREAAVNYNLEAAKTLTQVDQTGVTVKDIGDIGLRVAKAIPAPLNQLQAGLYDIFSSMDVSVADSEAILKGFAKSAVAGQVDVQTAGRQTISMMNAFDLTTADLTRIQDVQFQLVRKGVGTYEEFAKSIGRAQPSARRAGQSIEDLAGVMAFLTRNGLSTSMAATSASRAFDNLANPKVITNFNNLGVSVTDAHGAFRPMVDIVGELSTKLGPLTDEQRAAALDKLFKGGGNNIQARRFWDLAIRDFESLNGLTGDMVNASGALDSAYDIMFNQPASQSQLLDNNLQALRIELGEHLIPAFNKLVEWAIKVVQWFDSLSDRSKKLIVAALAFVSAFLLVAGIAMVFVGAFKMIHGAISLIGGLPALLNPTVLLILALAAAAVYIYQNWDKFKPYWDALWAWTKDKVNAFLDWFMPLWEKYWPEIKQTAIDVWNWIKNAWKVTWDFVVTTAKKFLDWFLPLWAEYWPKIQRAAKAVWDWLVSAWQTSVDAIKTAAAWFWDTFGPGIMRVWDSLKENIGPIIRGIVDLIKVLWDNLVDAFNGIKDTVETVWPIISAIITTVVDFIWPYVRDAFERIWQVITDVMDNVVAVLKAAWDFIAGIIAAGIEIIRGVIDIIAGVFTGDWRRVWNGIKSIFEGVWNGIKTFISTTWDGIQAVIGGAIDVLKGALGLAWDQITSAASTAWDWIKTLAKLAWDTVASLISVPIDALKATLQAIWDALKGAAETGWNAIKAVIEPIVGTIVAIIDTIVSAVKTAIEWMGKLNPLSGGTEGNSSTGELFKTRAAAAAAALAASRAGPRGNALGTNFWEGGWTLLGELGPELARLPRGTQIINANTSKHMMRHQSVPSTSTQTIGMWIQNATFEDHIDVEAAQKATNARLATMGVM